MLAVIKFLLVIIEVVVCLLLIGAILIQKTKGYGIGTALGGAGETVFGAHVGTVLTKATVILGIVFLVTTAFLALVGVRQANRRSVMDDAPVAPVTAPALPMQGGAAGGAAAIPATLPLDGMPAADPVVP